MGEPAFSINFTADMLASEACSTGDCLVFDSALGKWRIASAANRASANARTQAISLTEYGGSIVGKVSYQSSGVVAQSKTGLSAGSRQLVRASTAGRIERIASYNAGDDVLGYAEPDGRVHLHLGIPWDLIAGTAQRGPTIINDDTGQLDDIASDESGTQADVIVFTGAGSIDLTSIQGGTESRELTLINLLSGDGDEEITLFNEESAQGSAANRISFNDNDSVVVKHLNAVKLVYDSTTSRWRVVGGSGGTTITAANVGDGADIYKEEVDGELRFRGITGAGGITATVDGDNIEIDGSGISSDVTLANASGAGANLVDTSGAPDYDIARLRGSAWSPVTQTSDAQIDLGYSDTPHDAPDGATLDDMALETSGQPVNSVYAGINGAQTITSIAAKSERVITIKARSFEVTLQHNSGGSAANRIWTPTGENVVIPVGGMAVLRYVNVRWTLAHFVTAGDMSTSASTGNIDNLTTINAAGVPVWGILFTGAAPVLRGLANGAERKGRPLHLFSGGGPLVLHQDDGSSSTAANRFNFANGESVRITAEGGCIVGWNATTSRWYLIGRGDENCKEPSHTHQVEHLWTDSSGNESTAASLLVDSKRVVTATATTSETTIYSYPVPDAASGTWDIYKLVADISGGGADGTYQTSVKTWFSVDDAGTEQESGGTGFTTEIGDESIFDTYFDASSNSVKITVTPASSTAAKWGVVAQLEKFASVTEPSE